MNWLVATVPIGMRVRPRWANGVTVYNVTADCVVARKAMLDLMAPTIKSPSQTESQLDPPNTPPSWWADALLDV